MAPSTTLDLEPGLYFDEGVYTLAEVTLEISELAKAAGWQADGGAIEILEHGIERDPHTGWCRWTTSDYAEIGPELYEDLTFYLTDHLENGRWFGYLNEGGGWGVWDYGEED